MAPQGYEMVAVQSESSQRPKTANTVHEDPVLSARSSVTIHEPAIMKLEKGKAVWPLFVFIFYLACAASGWTILCMATKRPVNGLKRYILEDDNRHTDMTSNEGVIRTAKVLLAIAAILTIPITSTICSAAFAAYMQAEKRRTKLDLRRTMALADQGWISPAILINPAQLGSFPLYLAFVLTLIGSISQIVQPVLIDYEPIKVHKRSQTGTIGRGVPDVAALIEDDTVRVRDTSLLLDLRSGIDSVRYLDFEQFLWSDASTTEDNPKMDLLTSKGAASDTGSYYVPLPAGFSTGAYPEPMHAPRLNSSLSYVEITANEMANKCSSREAVEENDGFYATYEADSSFRMVACMPGSLRLSPWNATRDRQDISETLYLSIFVRAYHVENKYFKATANTTLGYFELPRYKNGNKAGPLQQEDPVTRRGYWYRDNLAGKDYRQKRQTNNTLTDQATRIRSPNQGPLTYLALALFGHGSFIQTRTANPSAYVIATLDGKRPYKDDGICTSTGPFMLYMDGSSACIPDTELLNESHVLNHVGGWLNYFVIRDGEPPLSMLNMGLFLAGKAWLGGSVSGGARGIRSMTMYYEEGVSSFKPKISNTGMIVGSVFLGLHLLGLLALAIYTLNTKPWVGELGAEVMVKMGMVHSEMLASAEGEKQWYDMTQLCPGYIGDERPNDAVGRIRAGAASRLSRVTGRKFEVLK